MEEIPIHTSPPYSEEAKDDALFHYTTANGLVGILTTGQIWSTAYYCANDGSELAVGNGILTPTFSRATHEMIKANDPLVQIFSSRGVDIREYAAGFENQITGRALNDLCAYITCFCKPSGVEDFHHGLLSQWRGYGSDGGYALQFSREKLLYEIQNANNKDGTSYDLQDVYYSTDNKLKAEVLEHADVFLKAYMEFLEELGQPLDLKRKTMRNPLSNLVNGPLERLLDYLIYTKNAHFVEERECRLSLVDLVSSENIGLPSQYFNRNGLIVPYKSTPPSSFNILKCVDWIIVGPNSRMTARFRSVVQIIRQLGLEISVRPSHIPFIRV